MDFSQSLGGFGDAFGAATTSFATGITGSLGAALGAKLEKKLGLAPKSSGNTGSGAAANAATAGTPNLVVIPAQAADAAGLSTGAVVGIAIGAAVLVGLVVFVATR